ncbi:MAG: NAD(P)H-dependent oxidoreductase subunit E [Bacillota bacterium]
MSGGCACGSRVTPDQLGEVERIIDPYRGQPGSLIQALHGVQNSVGYLPRDVQVRVAEGLGVPLARVYGVVSFYSFFTTVPRGKHKISVCAGTACYVRGANQLLNKLEEELQIKPGETSRDGEFSLGVVRCVGACGLGPVVTVNEDVYARVHPEKLTDILSSYTKE